MNSLLTVATLGAAVAAINVTAQDPPVRVMVDDLLHGEFAVISPSCDGETIWHAESGSGRFEHYIWDGDALNIIRWDDESKRDVTVATFAAEDPNSIDCSIYDIYGA